MARTPDELVDAIRAASRGERWIPPTLSSRALDLMARRAPGLAALLTIFLLSLTGIPPTAGFMGKFFVFGAAVQSQMWVLLAIAAINSVVAAFYYLNIVRYMFFVPATEEGEPIRVGRPLQSALAITAVITLLLGIVPGRVIAWASESARSLLLALR